MCDLILVQACAATDPNTSGYPNQHASHPPTVVSAKAQALATAVLTPVPLVTAAPSTQVLGLAGDATDNQDAKPSASNAYIGTAAPLPNDIERSYLGSGGDGATHRNALATKYANLQPGACRSEMRRRKILASSAAGMALGIATPMRINGPLGGIRWVTPGPKVVFGMLDCRLVLLLDDLSQLLSASGVSVVYVDGFYRPKAHLPGKKAPSQHAFGLAIDIHGFGTKEGRTLLIERDFGGKIGEPVCGQHAWIEPQTRDTIELRNIVCAMARAQVFHYLLTPNHDPSHSNHLHGDIKRGAREHVVR